MLKYVDVMETFSEVPDEITLAINISNCPHRCPNCHSSYLQKDIGEELTTVALHHLIEQHRGITCIAFLGGDNDMLSLLKLVSFVKKYYAIKTCWYTGYDDLPDIIFTICWFLDYIKVGSYQEKLGPLTSPKTNQKFFKCSGDRWENITYKFQS